MLIAVWVREGASDCESVGCSQFVSHPTLTSGPTADRRSLFNLGPPCSNGNPSSSDAVSSQLATARMCNHLLGMSDPFAQRHLQSTHAPLTSFMGRVIDARAADGRQALLHRNRIAAHRQGLPFRLPSRSRCIGHRIAASKTLPETAARPVQQ